MLRVLLQLFFPQTCIHCKHAPYPLCDHCTTLWEKERRPFPCYRPPHVQGLSFLISPYYLGPLTQKLIHTGKYRREKDIFRWIGQHLPEKHILIHTNGTPLDPQQCILVPIPLHKKRKHERGYNQAEILAHALGEKTGIPVHHLLKRLRYTVPQASLPRKERLTNLTGAFQYAHQRKECLDKTILIIDDVTTTFSTLEEAAKVLRKVGYKEIIGWTIAHAPLAHPQKTS